MSYTEWEIREAAWAILRDRKGMEASGHAAAVRWAVAVIEGHPRSGAASAGDAGAAAPARKVVRAGVAPAVSDPADLPAAPEDA